MAKTSKAKAALTSAFSAASDSSKTAKKNKITNLSDGTAVNDLSRSDNKGKVNHSTKVTNIDAKSTTGTGHSSGTSGAIAAAAAGTTGTSSYTNPSDIQLNQAQLRDYGKVSSYDPYSDSQYSRQLQEYRDAIAGAYERQRQESDKQYDANKSAADRQLLSRGMGRSSYGAQVLANIDTEKAKARQTISDKEQEAAQQYGVQLASELRSQNQWEQGQNYQRLRDAYSDYNADRSYNLTEYQTRVGQANTDRAFQYQQGRDTVADSQWQQQFDYTKASTEQQIAYSALQAAAAAGNKGVSDDLLARAGISRQDYNQWLKGGGKSGGGGRGGSNPGTQQPGTQPPGDTGDPSNWWVLANANYGNAAGNAALQAMGNQVKNAVNNVNNAYQTTRKPGGGAKRVAMTK